MPFCYFVQKLKDVSLSSLMEFVIQETDDEFWILRDEGRLAV